MRTSHFELLIYSVWLLRLYIESIKFWFIMKIRGLTLRFLIIVFTFFILAAAISAFWFFIETNRMVNELARNYALERAKAAKTRIALSVQRESALAEQLSSSPTIKRWILQEDNKKLYDEAFQELASYSDSFVDSNYFVIVDESKRYYNKSTGKELVISTLSKDEPLDKWYFETIKAGKEVTYNLDYNRSIQKSRVWINCLVHHRDTIIGMAGTGLEITDLISRYISKGTRGITTMLTDKSGEILAHPNTDLMEQNAKAETDEEKVTVFDLTTGEDNQQTLKNLLSAAQKGSSAVGTVRFEDASRLTAMVPIDELDALMIASVNTSSFVSLKDFIPLFAFLIITLLVALGLIALLMQRIVLHPLANLTESAHQISAGNYDLSIPVRRSDEIGTLATAFNGMAAKVKEYTTNLEKLVSERTKELSQANTQLESTNREIIESIRYARLIQEGVMATEESLASELPYYSFFHRQRDIVGGDFLFLRTITEGEKKAGFLLGVIDCEGHGVSGALNTMMVDSHLNQICNSYGTHDPAHILSKIEQTIGETLQKSGSQASITTGFDIGLCACYPEQNKLIFAGAGMPLYVRKADEQVVTVKGRKKAIKSKYRKQPQDFQNQTISTEGCAFYLLTDGFVDQAGGLEGRAFGTKRLYSLFSSIEPAQVDTENPAWENIFDEYRGKQNQRDDVLALGFTLRRHNY